MENKSPEAAYATMNNIVLQEDTISDALPATAKAQHVSKMDNEAPAKNARAGLTYMGNVTSPAVKRGK